MRHVQDCVSAKKTCGTAALKLISQAAAVKELDALRAYGGEFSSVVDAGIEKEAPLALRRRLRDLVPG